MWSSIWSWFIISVCLIDITKTEDVENKKSYDYYSSDELEK